MEDILIKPLKRLGSLWIYRDQIVSNIEKIHPGTPVRVYEEKTKKIVGTGYINPKSAISIRLLSFQEEDLNREFIFKRIIKCKDYREKFLGLKGSYRLVYGESDFMPGLIVDKYENCIVIQTLTAGMENLKKLIIEVIDELFSPETIIIKNDSQARLKEGLEIEKRVVKGGDKRIIIREDDLYFYCDPIHGQKTGFFLDQRENRILLKNLINQGEGLDLFCYLGAWSIHLAKKCNKVIGIDISERAIELCKENAKLNSLDKKCKFIKANVFEYLKWEVKRGKKYDFIVVDPPAFVKSREEKEDAVSGYLNLNKMCIKLLKKEGILATSSCSQHISEFEFLEIIKEALNRNRKTGTLIYKGTQSKDHPILVSMPETAYLKCLILKVY
ncbi:MAG: class I SAM-dependent rRNA methyltransferase [Thermodesulfovibrio sp.]|nr:class I SAM-dependent rRNA methyltransferase [Thermodesulfovibrio sp.]